MQSRDELAIEKWKRGLNCCQAIVASYCDELNIDESLLIKLSEGFGSGICGLRKTCGALTGAVIIAGLINSDGDLNAPTTKKQTYELGKKILDEFYEINKSTDCNDLKGLSDKKILVPCQKCISDTCLLIEKYLIK